MMKITIGNVVAFFLAIQTSAKKNFDRLLQGGATATVYNREDCSENGAGDSTPFAYVTFSIEDHEEANCVGCWDSCFETFEDASDAHTYVRSIFVPSGYIALAYTVCLASFGTKNPSSIFYGAFESGCHSFGTHVVHFEFATEVATGVFQTLDQQQNERETGFFEDVFETGHWDMGPWGASETDGLSMYTHVHQVLQPGQSRSNFQMGSGTTITPVIPWQEGDACHCDPNGEFGFCCSNGCDGSYQVMEGGPGYWLRKLPTLTPKFAMGAVTGCYSAWSNSPLEVTNRDDLPCDELGVIPVSNRLLIAPDGFAVHQDGMLGYSYLNTPLGRTSPTDTRRSLTLVLDTLNFKGPVAFMLPAFFSEQGKYQDDNGVFQPIDDFTSVDKVNNNGYSLEWNFLNFIGETTEQSRSVRIPRMQFALNDGRRSVIMTGFRSYDNTDNFFQSFESLLEGSRQSLPPLPTATNLDCDSYGRELGLSYDLRGWSIGGMMVTQQEGEECVASIEWDYDAPGLDCSSGDFCRTAEAFELTDMSITRDEETNEINVEFGRMIPLEKVPNSLRNQELPDYFTDERNPLRYDRTDSDLCGATSADDLLRCVQSQAGDWIGYKWFRFVDQPGLQRLQLSESDKDWLQARIVRLHESMMADSPLNEWLVPPDDVPPLAGVDPSQIVDPPPEFSVGYVPIVTYQGMDMPRSCDIIESSSNTGSN